MFSTTGERYIMTLLGVLSFTEQGMLNVVMRSVTITYDIRGL